MTKSVPSVSMTYARSGASTKANELGMRAMQERAYDKRGEQYLLIKSPPASGKSRALMFIALDKLHNQGIKQADHRRAGALDRRQFRRRAAVEIRLLGGLGGEAAVEPLQRPRRRRDPRRQDPMSRRSATFWPAAIPCWSAHMRPSASPSMSWASRPFDDRLIAVDEFHHVSANPDNRLGEQVRQLIARDKAHLVAMTGSYFRGDAVAVLSPEDEAKFETVTYTYYEQLNGYEHLKSLDIGYYFYSGSYLDAIMKVLDPSRRRSCTSRTSTRARAPRTRSRRPKRSWTPSASGRASTP